MDNKTFKLSAIAKTVLPLISVAVISGCGSDSSSDDTTNPGSGLHPAGENEVVIYYKRDVASASTASDYEGWGYYLYHGRLNGLGLHVFQRRKTVGVDQIWQPLD